MKSSSMRYSSSARGCGRTLADSAEVHPPADAVVGDVHPVAPGDLRVEPREPARRGCSRPADIELVALAQPAALAHRHEVVGAPLEPDVGRARQAELHAEVVLLVDRVAVAVGLVLGVEVRRDLVEGPGVQEAALRLAVDACGSRSGRRSRCRRGSRCPTSSTDEELRASALPLWLQSTRAGVAARARPLRRGRPARRAAPWSTTRGTARARGSRAVRPPRDVRAGDAVVAAALVGPVGERRGPTVVPPPTCARSRPTVASDLRSWRRVLRAVGARAAARARRRRPSR